MHRSWTSNYIWFIAFDIMHSTFSCFFSFVWTVIKELLQTTPHMWTWVYINRERAFTQILREGHARTVWCVHLIFHSVVWEAKGPMLEHVDQIGPPMEASTCCVTIHQLLRRTLDGWGALWQSNITTLMWNVKWSMCVYERGVALYMCMLVHVSMHEYICMCVNVCVRVCVRDNNSG